MSISVLNCDELARVVGGADDDNPCGVPLPSPQHFSGSKSRQIKKAVAQYVASPGFNLADEIHYFTSRAPGTLDAHGAKICSTPSGRQYISNMIGILG